MSLIPQEKLNSKIQELFNSDFTNTFENRATVDDLISWYNEQIVEELEGIITAYTDLDRYNADEVINDLAKIISKLQDTLPDNKE